MVEFNVGDKVFVSSIKYSETFITCPDCLGKRKVIVIMGNGDKVSIPCATCSKEYVEPTGHISKYVYVPEVTEQEIAEIRIKKSGREYVTTTSFVTKEVFYSLGEAELRATQMVAERNKEVEAEEALRTFLTPSKPWAEHVSFYSSRLREAEKEVERLRKLFSIAKDKSESEAVWIRFRNTCSGILSDIEDIEGKPEDKSSGKEEIPKKEKTR